MEQKQHRDQDIEASNDGHRNLNPLFDVFKKSLSKTTFDDSISMKIHDKDFILSVPHSGTLVPKEMLEDIDDSDMLIEIDMLSDAIYDIKKGIHIQSLIAPFIIDMNRARDGSKDSPVHLRNDPLNYITIEEKPIRKRTLPPEMGSKLIEHYDRYHAMIDEAIRLMKEKHGFALLIDGHSMTSSGLRNSVDAGKKRADLVIGTLGGSSANSKIIDIFRDELEKGASGLGLTVAVDKPYSGGFITRMHSADADCIQLEVSMGTYLHEGLSDDDHEKYHLKKQHSDIKDIITSAIMKAVETARDIYRQDLSR